MTDAPGYISLDEFHSMKRIETDKVSDDDAINFLIKSASRYIDHNTSRRFWLPDADEIHYFNIPGWEAWINSGHGYYSGYGNPTQINEPNLFLDDDLYSLTSVTNGDGTLLTENTDFVQVPFNATPKYKLTMIGSNYWKPAANAIPVHCIQVSGKWGFCPLTEVPDDIKMACQQIVLSAYNRRLGENVLNKVTVTQAGATISADDVPELAADIIRCHLRLAFG
jgi:hypothetical protein